MGKAPLSARGENPLGPCWVIAGADDAEVPEAMGGADGHAQILKGSTHFSASPWKSPGLRGGSAWQGTGTGGGLESPA